MSIKYDNSMYTTIPPRPFIDYDGNPEDDYYAELIDEHNFEENYEQQQIKTAYDFEEAEFKELIKHEQRKSF